MLVQGALVYNEPIVTILVCQMYFSKTKNRKFIAPFKNFASTAFWSLIYDLINPLQLGVAFLYPLKTSENL